MSDIVLAADAGSRRTVRLIGVAMICEAVMLSVLAPLLPGYVRTLEISTTQAGVLAALFGCGLVLASIPAGRLASAIGGRRTAVSGLVLLAGTTTAFGLAEGLLALDLARFVQGIAAALIWSGALAWVAGETPEDQMGQAVGRIMGIAIMGTLLGPPVGALAAATSTVLVFSTFAVVILLFGVLLARLPERPVDQPARGPLSALLRRGQRGRVAASAWQLLLPSMGFAMVAVLGSLRLDEVGTASFGIAIVFVLGGLAEAAASPLAGRVTDRRGPHLMTRVATVVVALLLVVTTLPEAPALVGLAIVLTLGGFGLFWVPATLGLQRTIADAGIVDARAWGVSVVCFAGGQMIGAPVGSVLSDLGGMDLALGLMAGVFALSAFASFTPARSREDVASAATPTG